MFLPSLNSKAHDFNSFLYPLIGNLNGALRLFAFVFFLFSLYDKTYPLIVIVVPAAGIIPVVDSIIKLINFLMEFQLWIPPMGY